MCHPSEMVQISLIWSPANEMQNNNTKELQTNCYCTRVGLPYSYCSNHSQWWRLPSSRWGLERNPCSTKSNRKISEFQSHCCLLPKCSPFQQPVQCEVAAYVCCHPGHSLFCHENAHTEEGFTDPCTQSPQCMSALIPMTSLDAIDSDADACGDP